MPRTSAGVVKSAMEGDDVFRINPAEVLKNNGVLPVPPKGPEGAFFCLGACCDRGSKPTQ